MPACPQVGSLRTEREEWRSLLKESEDEGAVATLRNLLRQRDAEVDTLTHRIASMLDTAMHEGAPPGIASSPASAPSASEAATPPPPPGGGGGDGGGGGGGGSTPAAAASGRRASGSMGSGGLLKGFGRRPSFERGGR